MLLEEKEQILDWLLLYIIYMYMVSCIFKVLYYINYTSKENNTTKINSHTQWQQQQRQQCLFSTRRSDTRAKARTRMRCVRTCTLHVAKERRTGLTRFWQMTQISTSTACRRTKKTNRGKGSLNLNKVPKWSFKHFMKKKNHECTPHKLDVSV